MQIPITPTFEAHQAARAVIEKAIAQLESEGTPRALVIEALNHHSQIQQILDRRDASATATTPNAGTPTTAENQS